MHRYLLDTSVINEITRISNGRARLALERRGIASVCTSIVVAAGLRYGAAKKNSDRLLANIEATLAALNVMPFASPAERHYAEIRLSLERIGRPIGGNDLLIAAHALALDCVLVTSNTSEFSRVPDLRVESWL